MNAHTKTVELMNSAAHISGEHASWPEALAAIAATPDADRLDAAIKASEEFKPFYEAAGRRHNKAEEAVQAAEEPSVPYPDVLTVISPGFAMVRGDRRIEINDSAFTYKSTQSIETSDLPADRKAEMAAALERWERDFDEACVASGLGAILAEERAADQAFQDALQHRLDLGQAILASPARTPHDIRRKLNAYAKTEDGQSWEDLPHDEAVRNALDAVMRDIDLAAEPVPSPPFTFNALEREFDRLWAEEKKLYETPGHTDTDVDAAHLRLEAVARQIMATPATTVADFKVKARAVSWCFGGDPLNLMGVEPDEYRPTCIVFAEQLINELLGQSLALAPENFIRQEWADLQTKAQTALALLRETQASGVADDEGIADEADYQAFNALRYATPPDFDALLEKCRLFIAENQRDGHFDDHLLKAIKGGDEFHLGLVYQDLQALLRMAGRPLPIEPRSLNERLYDLETTVHANRLENPTAAALGLMSTITHDDTTELMAAAWIDDFLTVGGTISQSKDGTLYFGSPVPTSEALQQLLNLIDPMQDKVGLRPAAAKLAKRQMKERRIVFMGSTTAQEAYAAPVEAAPFAEAVA
jgi:hypothetical protein